MLPAKQRSERSPPTVSQRPAVETSLERAPSPLQVLQTLLKGGHGRARARSPARGHHSGAAQPAAGTGPPPRRATIPAQLRGHPAVSLPEAGSGRWRWLTLVRAQVQKTRCKFQSLLFGLQLPTTLKSGSAGDPAPPPTHTRAHGARARRLPQPGFEIGTAQEFWPPVACALQARVPAPVLQVCSCSPCLPHELPPRRACAVVRVHTSNTSARVSRHVMADAKRGSRACASAGWFVGARVRRPHHAPACGAGPQLAGRAAGHSQEYATRVPSPFLAQQPGAVATLLLVLLGGGLVRGIAQARDHSP